MPETETYLDPLLQIVREVYEKLPFNQVLGLKVEYINLTGAGFTFPMNEDLVGNYVHGILHGGAISAVLDATGGMTATASAMQRLDPPDSQKARDRIARIGTIDMRVDYLRPGKGTRFFTAGTVMRAGRKVAVTRMELKNQDGLMIAVGTGAYIIA